MKKFVFNGDWKTRINLPEFEKLNNEQFVGSNNQINDSLIVFNDLEDNNPDPLKTQINTINFIVNREIEILTSIFNYFKDVIYPKSKIHIEPKDYPHCYPKLESLEDLINIFSLSNIEILTESNDGFSYYTIYIWSCLDFGHGLGIIMHKSRCLDFNEIGVLDYEKIKDEGSIIKKDSFDNIQINESGIYSRHPKYNNLKPWQLDLAENTFKKLLESGNESRVIELIDKLDWSVNTKFPSSSVDLLCISCNSLAVKVSNYLIKKGANIDSFNSRNQTGLFTTLKIFADVKWNAHSYKKNNREKFKMYTNKANSYIPKIELFLKLGANPEVCNNKSESYKDIFRKKWNDEYLNSSGILNEIDSLIKNSTRSKIWKFWKK